MSTVLKLGTVREGRWPDKTRRVVQGHAPMYAITTWRALSVVAFFREVARFHGACTEYGGTVRIGADEALLLIDMLRSGEFRSRYNDRMGDETRNRLTYTLSRIGLNRDCPAFCFQME